MKANIKDIFHEGAISPGLIADSIRKYSAAAAAGAHAIFIGQVRADVIRKDRVSSITYTAYRELALETMQAIRAAILEKYDLAEMEVHHSLGEVAAGEICLFVLAVSAHRKAAMEACNELVERVKNELPIWGRECFEKEGYQWKINK